MGARELATQWYGNLQFFSMAAIIDKAKQAVMEAATGLKMAFGM